MVVCEPAPAGFDPWPELGCGELVSECVGSFPRPAFLKRVAVDCETGLADFAELETARDLAVADTLRGLRATGARMLCDGEMRRTGFASYPLGVDGSFGVSGDEPVFAVFADGHHRVLPRLNAVPFRFRAFAADDLVLARGVCDAPLKQAVVSPSMLSLMFPAAGFAGYSREEFLDDVVAGCVEDISRCFAAGASRVSIDFTEGRLALHEGLRAPWAGPDALHGFIELLNRVLDVLPEWQRAACGVHTCPGSDNDSRHSADVDYGKLIPELFQIEAGYFLVQAASEVEPARVARLVGAQLVRMGDGPDGGGSVSRVHGRGRPRVLLGVTDPARPRLETPEEVARQLVEAARFIPPELLGSTDDCGFSPYMFDEKPRHGSADFAREVAFAKVAARVRGSRLARERLWGVGGDGGDGGRVVAGGGV